jgi:hypothetical protein
MSFENLNSKHFMVNEMQAIAKMIITLESKLAPKFIKTASEERDKCASMDEQNMKFINNVEDYRSSQPHLCSPNVDWEEFQANFNSSSFLELVIARLQHMAEGLSANKIIHDSKNYQAALADYEYSESKACRYVEGFEEKADDLARFFDHFKTSKSAS